jgi:lysozyme
MTPAIPHHKLVPLIEHVWKLNGYKDPLPAAFAWGCRGYYSETFAPRGNNRGINDDAIGFITDQVDYRVRANTDPSVYRQGVASLRADQVIWYRPGWHGYASVYGHPAFRQDSNVVVKRDGTENIRKGITHRKFGICLGNGFWTDLNYGEKFWTNLHRQSRSGTSSLGCLTVPEYPWKALHALITSELKRLALPRFPLILLDGPIN